MHFVLLTHSLRSDWNHGNAHFLRGVVTELLSRHHTVSVLEPAESWSWTNLLTEPDASTAITGYHAAYPLLRTSLYNPDTFVPEEHIEEADAVLVHEWTDRRIVRLLGQARARRSGVFSDRGVLLFHDTHHRVVTAPDEMRRYDLTHYDAVLAFGQVLAEMYRRLRLHPRPLVWHEAADPRVFHPPLDDSTRSKDLVWIGNWGDDERTAELDEFLFKPTRQLRLTGTIHGVRYPPQARQKVEDAGLTYAGYLPNHRATQAFAQHKLTIHVPRRPYTQALPGIPTIRVFEALAAGIPLVCAPWQDSEHLFTPGEDFLTARDGDEMIHHLRTLLHDEGARQALAQRGLRTVLARHTVAHRVDQLLGYLEDLRQHPTDHIHPARLTTTS